MVKEVAVKESLPKNLPNLSSMDAASSVAKPTVSSQVSEGETAAVDLSVSQSMESSLPSGLDTAAIVSSPEPIASETGNVKTVVAHNAGLPLQVAALGECDADSSVPNGEESTQSVDSKESTEIPSSTAYIPVFEGETKHDDVPHPSASVYTTEGTVVKLDLAGVNKEMEQNLLLSQDDFPDMSLSRASGDQVTNGQCRKLMV